MRKYFYLVSFKYRIDKQHESWLDLGVFSTKAKAEKKIQESSDKIGFKDYHRINFKISRIGVDFDFDIKDKSRVVLFCVTHEYEKDKVTYWQIFDYFSTQTKAEERIEYLKKHSRIGRKFPTCFEIVDIKVDNYNAWSEGFIRC